MTSASTLTWTTVFIPVDKPKTSKKKGATRTRTVLLASAPSGLLLASAESDAVIPELWTISVYRESAMHRWNVVGDAAKAQEFTAAKIEAPEDTRGQTTPVGPMLVH